MIRRQCSQIVVGGLGLGLERIGLTIEVCRHPFGDVVENIAGLLGDVGAKHCRRVFHHGLHPVAEPSLNALVNQHPVKDRDDQGGDEGCQGEQPDKSQVQPCASVLSAHPQEREDAN